MRKFNVNQIVKGRVAGYFIVLGYRVLNDRLLVQVKLYDRNTQQAMSGEMALEESCFEDIYE